MKRIPQKLEGLGYRIMKTASWCTPCDRRTEILQTDGR